MHKSVTTFVLSLAAIGASPILGAGPDLDIRSFGAACNGTSDDRGALQQALDALPSTGGTLSISCMLGVGGNGVVLQGKSNVVVRASTSGAGIRSLSRTSQNVQGFGPVTFAVRQCTNCRIEGLTFEGNNVDVGPLGFDRCTNTVAEGNVIRNVGANFAGGAISAAGNRGNQYLRNTIDGTREGPGGAVRGMWLGNPGSSEQEWYPVASGNTIRNAAATGIALHPVGATLTDNYIENTLGAGIKIVPVPGQSAANLVERNTLRRNKFSGLQIDSAYNLTVRNNVMEENQMGGIFVYLGLTNSSIVNNIVRDNNSDRLGGWQGGIYIHHAYNATIAGNQIYDTRSGSARTQDNAIVFNAVSSGGIRNVKVTNNICRNSAVHGIAIYNDGGTLSDIEITGNQCTQNAGYGLHVNEKSAGALRNIREGGNNFDGNASGRIYDNSQQGVISGITPSTPETNPTPAGLAAAIASPADNATVSGTITLSANVSSGYSITGVQFKIDGANYGPEVRYTPYAVQLDTRSLNNGRHAISATARDAGNRVVDTATIYINVDNPLDSSAPPPTDNPVPPGTGTFVTSYSAGSLVTGGYKGWAGMRVRIGASPITITHLGRWKLANNTKMHTVKIVNASNGSDVPGGSAQVNLSGQPVGQFAYGALAAPVVLSANTEYLIVSSEHVNQNAGDFFHDYNGALTTTTVAQVQSAVYWNGGSWTRLGSTNQSIGPVNFKFAGGSTEQTPPVTPTPDTPTTPTQPTGSETAFVPSFTPASFVTGGYTGWAGMRIRVGASPITITQLGRWKLANNTQTHTVKIVNANGSDLPGAAAQVALGGQPAGQFVYGALASPVTLNANTEYLVVSSESVVQNSGDYFCDFDGVLTTTSAAQVLNAVFWSGSSWTALGTVNRSIGPVTFKYR